MSLSVGIVGLPNVGKSTLFNALLKRQQAYVANFPFATIEPNVGVVPVPDERLRRLADVIESETNPSTGSTALTTSPLRVSRPPEVPSIVQFIDIAGLIAGAHKGEGLGNKFLSHIREVSAIAHVVRAFSDPDIVKQGVANPKSDFETIETELKLADLQTLEKQKDPGNTPDADLRKKWEVVLKLKDAIQKGIPGRDLELGEEERKFAKELSLLTSKPILVVLNVDEGDLKEGNKIEIGFASSVGIHTSQVVAISAKIESELSTLSLVDQEAYLSDLDVRESGLGRLIKKAFETLGLITYLTAGVKEVRAWTISKGMNAQEAAGVIHTDFMKNFIKADVCDFDKFVEAPGWKAARDTGYVRIEGKDYIVKDGEVIEFKIGSG